MAHSARPAASPTAEGFISLNAETHYLLPVTEYALKRARSSDHEIMAAYSYRLKVD